VLNAKYLAQYLREKAGKLQKNEMQSTIAALDDECRGRGILNRITS
jgi:hypothetical protein